MIFYNVYIQLLILLFCSIIPDFQYLPMEETWRTLLNSKVSWQLYSSHKVALRSITLNTIMTARAQWELLFRETCRRRVDASIYASMDIRARVYNPVNAIRSLQMHRMNASPVNVIGPQRSAFSTFVPQAN